MRCEDVRRPAKTSAHCPELPPPRASPGHRGVQTRPQGRSTGAGALLLWLRPLRGFSYSDNYTACPGLQPPVERAVTAGPGTGWGEIYQVRRPPHAEAVVRARCLYPTCCGCLSISMALQASRSAARGTVASEAVAVTLCTPTLQDLAATPFAVVGGSAKTVSAAGGFLQGGGHGFMSPAAGLAVDNVLALTAVRAVKAGTAKSGAVQAEAAPHARVIGSSSAALRSIVHAPSSRPLERNYLFI